MPRLPPSYQWRLVTIKRVAVLVVGALLIAAGCGTVGGGGGHATASGAPRLARSSSVAGAPSSTGKATPTTTSVAQTKAPAGTTTKGSASGSHTTTPSACTAQSVAGTWSTTTGKAIDSTTARIEPVQFSLGMMGANGTFANAGPVFPPKESLTVSVSFENVGDPGKVSTLALKPYSVPLEILALHSDGSEGAPVWRADVTGAPTTLQPYEIPSTKLDWNETGCTGAQVPPGMYRLKLSGVVSISGTANGDPVNANVGAYPYYVDFSIR